MTRRNDLMKALADARAFAATCEREVVDLAQRYPGVCPSWVSTDIAIARRNGEQYRLEAEQIKRQLERTPPA